VLAMLFAQTWVHVVFGVCVSCLYGSSSASNGNLGNFPTLTICNSCSYVIAFVCVDFVCRVCLFVLALLRFYHF